MYSRELLEAHTKEELKEICRLNGLKVSGNKSTLIKRILNIEDDRKNLQLKKKFQLIRKNENEVELKEPLVTTICKIIITSDILIHIFEFMVRDGEFLKGPGMVNKVWYHSARHPKLWKEIKISSTFVELVPLRILRNVEIATLINRWRAKDIDYLCKYLKKAKLCKIGNMEGWRLLLRRIAKKKFPVLEFLDIGNVDISDYLKVRN